ncbi:glycosyltransferase [Yoonia sp. F2084L]|uniref:glycosyltransferase n=1 Tax=Yoonia sp. F2084L TaxID=2926419 RepID=UPI001FF31D87|nr:glycosyltransferase [Yoonia sp. F2084L]
MLTVIIPSYNEENYIEACLNAVMAQSDLPADHGIQVIVAANGCKDKTVALAQAKIPALEDKGFTLKVLDIVRGNKMNALNEAEAITKYPTRAFLDADVIISPTLLRELSELLDDNAPRYASGTINIPRPASIVSRAYAKVWSNLPFVRDGVPGIGLYAMNGAGRARWAEFPAIYSDDRFVRLQFAPHERFKTKATYDWPLPEGFGNLMHVRHRWSEGNMELEEQYPALISNDRQRNKTSNNIWRLFRTPFSAAVFVTVYFVSNLRAKRTMNGQDFIWRRGRD